MVASSAFAPAPAQPPDDGVRSVREEPPAKNGRQPDTGVPPREHNSIVRVSLLTMAVIMTTGVVAYLGRVLEPLVFAVFLYFAIQPAAEFATRLRIPKWVAYAVILLGVMGLFFTLGAVIVDNFGRLQAHQEEYRRQLTEMADKVRPGFGATVMQSLQDGAKSWSAQAAWTMYGITEFGLMMFFFLVFILMTADSLPGRVRRAFPGQADEVLAVGEKISKGMRGYIGVKTVISLGMGVTAGVLLGVMNVAYWPLWAFLFFALNYITYIGSIAACVPPIALAFLQFETGTAVLVTALIIGVRFFWIDFLEIRMSGRELNTDSVLLLLALAFWGTFWGVAGLVLAVPMITSVKLVLESIDDTRPWAILMSER